MSVYVVVLFGICFKRVGAGLAPLGPLAEVCMLVFLCTSAWVCVCVCMSIRFVSFRVRVFVFLSFFVSACVCHCLCFWDDFRIIFNQISLNF